MINAGLQGRRAAGLGAALRSSSRPGDSQFVPMLCKVVVTLVNERNLRLFTGEEDAKAFSRVTHIGMDFETEILYPM